MENLKNLCQNLPTVKLLRATQKDFTDIRQFLIGYEKYCTALAALFVRSIPESGNTFVLKSRMPFEKQTYSSRRTETEVKTKTEKTSSLDGVLYISPGGMLYHCMCCARNKKVKKQTMHELQKVFTQYKVTGMTGERSSSLFLERCLKNLLEEKPRETRDCILMSFGEDKTCLKKTSVAARFAEFLFAKFWQIKKLNPSGFEPVLPNGCTVQRCSAKDTAALCTAECAYYSEEVLPPWIPIDEHKIRLLLANKLRTKLVFAVKNKNGKFISMAAAQAAGFYYAQVGGVYTFPNARKQGCASFLLHTLCRELKSCALTPVLFVRCANKKAAALYKNCGFRAYGLYRIVYC